MTIGALLKIAAIGSEPSVSSFFHAGAECLFMAANGQLSPTGLEGLRPRNAKTSTQPDVFAAWVIALPRVFIRRPS
jgi:hypothetical protein